MRSPEYIQAFLDQNSHRSDAPFQWLGDEPNTYRKDWDSADVRMLAFACWPYEQAAGNQAIPLVYKTVNEADGMLCDRSYFPSTPRDLRLMESVGVPIFGIESRHPMQDFDVLGTSISYPVLAINFIKQLKMSDIPPTWDDYEFKGVTRPGRARVPQGWPFVMVGGQAFGTPEVIANIADAIFCGEAEDEPGNPGLVAVLDAIRDFKRAGLWAGDREECYRRLAREFSFLYFPRFFDVRYAYERRPTVDRVMGQESEPSKQVAAIVPTLDGMRGVVTKRFVHDLNAVAPLDNPPLLYNDPGMGAGDLEVARGCPAWCSFCKLSWTTKPYRQRDVEHVEAHARELVRNTGGIHLAPYAPDFPMHTNKRLLMRTLLENVSDEIDMSSMRVDDFTGDDQYVRLSAVGGVDSVTLGVEGNSQRMRDFVGKGTSDEDVLQAVSLAIKNGMKRIKLYMIAFMPGEDEGDVFRLLSLAREIADIRDSAGATTFIEFSWTPMIIEGNTPFQWFAPTTVNFAYQDLWEKLRDLKIAFKLGSKIRKDKLVFQQLSQRASREQGKAIVEAVIELDQGMWGGVPMTLYETMEARLKAHGFDNMFADAFDERFKNDLFGWEHIDQGINVELMWQAYQQMREFLEFTDSETYDRQFPADYRGNEWIERCDTRCMGRTCGVCDMHDLKIRRGYIEAAAAEPEVSMADLEVVDQRTVAMRVRARVHRDVTHRYADPVHFIYAFRRAANRAGLPITKRTVKFAGQNQKFKNWTTGVDYLEFGLLRKVGDAELAAKLYNLVNKELGSAMQIEAYEVFPANVSALRYDIDASLYEVELDVTPEHARGALVSWHDASYVKVVINERKATGVLREEVNGKDYVRDLWILQRGHRVFVRFYLRGAVNPYAIVQGFLGKNSWIELSRYPVVRLGAFVKMDASQDDFFRVSCEGCGDVVPVDPLDEPYDERFCPKCKDQASKVAV